MITKEDSAQCKSNSDCSALGFDGATCNVSTGVCVRASDNSGDAGSSSSAGSGGNSASAGTGSSSAGASTGGNGGKGEVGGAGGSSVVSEGGDAGEPSGGKGPLCAGNCSDPVGVRLVETAKLPQYQPPGTLLGAEQFHTDVCPQDQVLTGLNLTFGSDSSTNKFLLDVQAVCSVSSLSATTPRTLELDPGASMPKRGSETASVNSTVVTCPATQIVTGWSGIEDSAHISKFVLRCAPINLATAGSVVTLSVGSTADVVPFAGYDSAATPLPAQDCPAGFVARGINVRLSDAMTSPQRLERFDLACGRPSLTYQKGAVCMGDGDCDSGACSGGFCAASSCVPAAGTECKCELLDTREYLFCGDTIAFTQAAGVLGCGASNMRLVKIDDGIENGWLFSTGLVHFPASSNDSGEWIGATDAAQEGKWVWLDQAQTQFWQGVNIDQGGMSVGGLYSAWKRVPTSEEPNNGHGAPNPPENCAFMDLEADDRWVDTKCTDLRSYACEYEDGR